MTRLTDAEIREICKRVENLGQEQSEFVKAFARAVCLAPRRDFLVMRPTALIMIAKYNLGPYCQRESMAISEPRPHCTRCGDTGFRPVEGAGDRRVTRCECRLAAVTRATRPVESQPTPIDHKSLAAGE